MANTTKEENKFIVFHTGEYKVAVNIKDVHSIEYFDEITPTPEGSNLIEGIVILREEVITVVSSRKLFGCSTHDYQFKDKCVVIADFGGVKRGLLVDKVLNIIDASKAVIQDNPEITKSESSIFPQVAIVDEDIILLLDLDAVSAKKGIGK